ncbi:MAG: transcriptional regulator [Alphaproteobacteria bacterium]|nr:transcriptional regulator [Alphaproteobacteria bacterium]
MMYVFNDFQLDVDRLELRRSGELISLEPQVFNLLKLLVERRDRAVSKGDIIDEVWQGRTVSDAAIASRIRLVRQALGDDGTAQHSIRTVHGYGFLFVAEVSVLSPTIAPQVPDRIEDLPLTLMPEITTGLSGTSKPSIVVLPFQLLGAATDTHVIADAIPHDLIQSLSRLRWLLVIARGTAFRFRAPDQDVLDIGKTLGVRYCLVGTIEMSKRTIKTSIELSDTQDGGIVWSDQTESVLERVHDLRAEIVGRVISALEIHIPMHEAKDVRLGASNNLDAWSNYHLGLQHMYRFNHTDNAKATALFERAVSQDPGFARAFAGLSFTHFQDAFVKYKDAPQKSAQAACHYAERSLEIDALDPFANFTMGRYFWLEGDLDASADWLDRTIKLSPNYAQCIYSRAFTEMLRGNTAEAHKNANNALLLSPLDPFQYGMLGVRSLSFIADGDFDSASIWGGRAAHSPGAHYLISMIAVIAHSLNGNDKKVLPLLKDIRQRKPDACQDQFFESFPFWDPKTRELISGALQRHGF